MKRILTIQDISCLGKCSLTVALPILSAMGIETVILPTAVLSTHTMFPDFTVKDLTDQLMPIVSHWKSQNVEFDAIYTGYLGSAEEIAITEKIFDLFSGATTFIDPVMADNGKLYPAFDEKYAALNAGLCGRADIIVPNITEACFMTGMDYREEYDEAYILELLDKLSHLGAKLVVVTGVSLSAGKTGVYGLDTETGDYFIYQNDRVDASYHGTGDIFASVAVGGMIRGLSREKAFALAADYTADTIRETLSNPRKPWYGVDFETTLPLLVKRLEAELG
ncbi:MAG: pyridoxamine kinase [Eubacterium sp.]|nr:pyridoxamine kinase [Eubacterium sp.]MBR6173862.1 pyridoxamine kinase [Eubacterium sp.]